MGALGRTVVERNRYARIIGLGDRRSPCVHTPCIVKIDGDPDLSEAIAPFSFIRDGSVSPASPWCARLWSGARAASRTGRRSPQGS